MGPQVLSRAQKQAKPCATGPWDAVVYPDRTRRFGDVRSPAGRVEPAPRDGECLRNVIRREADKSSELAVEPVERSPALPSTHEARPGPGRGGWTLGGVRSW